MTLHASHVACLLSLLVLGSPLALAQDLNFEDVSAESGLHYPGSSTNTARAVGDLDGDGAVIAVRAGGKTQTRWIVAGSSFHAVPPALAHFGLGDQAVAEHVRITWPSGQVQVLQDVAVDQVLQVVQP